MSAAALANTCFIIRKQTILSVKIRNPRDFCDRQILMTIAENGKKEGQTMDVKEAVEFLQSRIAIIAVYKPELEDYKNALEVAVDALEKQVPKKPINKTKLDDTASRAYENCNIIVCPTCGRRLKLKSKGRYCDKCGQKLDWGGNGK